VPTKIYSVTASAGLANGYPGGLLCGVSREDRFKELGRYSVPDHRLWPEELRQRIDRLPRNVRRVQKRVIDRSLRTAYDNIIASNSSGAGYPIDRQLREYLVEYNDRQLGHGLRALPSSFNVFEGFFEFRVNMPAHYFVLRPERDHLFSLGDFLDFMTNDGLRPHKLNLLSDLDAATQDV
jgi:hypothetical protein